MDFLDKLTDALQRVRGRLADARIVMQFGSLVTCHIPRDSAGIATVLGSHVSSETLCVGERVAVLAAVRRMNMVSIAAAKLRDDRDLMEDMRRAVADELAQSLQQVLLKAACSAVAHRDSKDDIVEVSVAIPVYQVSGPDHNYLILELPK